jgi:hypothetical protein
MGPMTVEMLDIDSQDRLEVASSEDEHPVEALTLERADEPIGDCVGLGALTGVRTIRSPSERKISSKAAAYFVSRSRIRNRNGGHSSHRTMRLRACWVTGPPHVALGMYAGFAVD